LTSDGTKELKSRLLNGHRPSQVGVRGLGEPAHVVFGLVAGAIYVGTI